MQATRLLARRSMFALQRRSASGEAWMSPRWSELTRKQSGILSSDEPPTAPLSEDHDIGDGECDFANWFDKGEDISMSQAVTGLGLALGFCYSVYKISVRNADSRPGRFTLRELPTLAGDIPYKASVDIPYQKASK